MKYVLFFLGLVATGLVLAPEDASAAVCGRGAYRAGCVGPRGAVGVGPRGAAVRRGAVVAPRGAVVAPRRVYVAPRY